MARRAAAIIGSGPAGYTAALYLARAGVRPLVLGGFASGGQLMLTSDVENFPGYPRGISGPDLMADLRAQAERFGAVVEDVDVDKLSLKGGVGEGFSLETALGDTHEADAVIIATGAEARWLGAANEAGFKGRGVSTCATCDGAFYRDKVVLVVGGGDSACGEALHLTHFASDVHMIVRRDELRASQIMQERVLSHPKITMHWRRAVEEWVPKSGDDDILGGAWLGSTSGTEIRELLDVDGGFLAIGHVPQTKFLGASGLEERVAMDAEGYVQTRGSDPEVWAAHRQDGWGTHEGTTLTTLPGLLACGDVVDKRYRQAITAAGMGCAAALDAEEWLNR